MSSSQALFQPAEPKPEIERTGILKLGDFSMSLDLCELPEQAGYFLYFRLNDHPELVSIAANMVMKKIKSLNFDKPYFVTPEASTIGLAQLLRHNHNIDGTIIYKTKTHGDTNPKKIKYKSVTSSQEKTLFLSKKKAEEMKGRDIILFDSVCTTSSTMKAMYQLLIDSGIEPSQIKIAITLFNEGEPREELVVANDVKLDLYSFGSLPLYRIPCANIKIGVVGSESAIKLQAIRDSLQQAVPGNLWEVKGVPAQSGKPEQPEEQETLEGAINRAHDALKINPDCDLVIAIESGLFKIDDPKAPEGYSYYDKAIIYCLTKDGQSHIYYSDLVQFPTKAVEEARSGNSFLVLPAKPTDYSAIKVNQLTMYLENGNLQYLVKDKNGNIQQAEVAAGSDADNLSPDHFQLLMKFVAEQTSGIICINDKKLFDAETKAVRALFDITAKRGHTVRRGFDKCTVGMVMEEWGIVKSNKDPHVSLSPFKPRAEYLKKAALLLCDNLFNREAKPVLINEIAITSAKL